MNNKISEIKNTLEGMTSGVDEAEGQISDWRTRQKKTPRQSKKKKRGAERMNRW